MSKSSKLRVMLSSKCLDPFPVGSTTLLSDIRKALKKEIEEQFLFNKQMFEVWINEDAPPAPGTDDSWEFCLSQVNDCDVLLVLSNGNAGWAKAGGDIGICHAEFTTGLSRSPGKVRIISLGKVTGGTKDEQGRNSRFQAEIEKQSLFRGSEAKDVNDLKCLVKEALHDAVLGLSQAGVREVSKGKFHRGQALDWTRLNFSDRQKEIVEVLRNALSNRPDAALVGDNVSVSLDQHNVLILPHAFPAALSISQASEMVGKPFLNDHKLAGILGKKLVGPVHVIACHETATKAQAIKLLGFSDAEVVTAPFGIFVADNIQKIQFAFIVNCRDEANTRHGVQRFMEWLEQTGEAGHVANRATSRTNIVKAIAKET